MHLLRKTLLPLIMLLLLCQSALAADFSKLVILHTNDTHGSRSSLKDLSVALLFITFNTLFSFQGAISSLF